MDITLNRTGISTDIYENPQNLYSYLLQHICHSPGVKFGTVFGIVKRSHYLILSPLKVCANIVKCFCRFLLQVHSHKDTLCQFKKALCKYSLQQKKYTSSQSPLQYNFLVFQHLDYHLDDIPSCMIQKYFWQYILKSLGEPHLSELTNGFGARLDIDWLIIAYHKPKTIRNYIFPCQFIQQQNHPVSSFIPES